MNEKPKRVYTKKNPVNKKTNENKKRVNTLTTVSKRGRKKNL